MIRSFPGASRLAAGALAALASLVLASCGSGAVSAPPNTASTGPITITPATATLFSDLPTTFVVGGGNGSFLISSSNQQALPTAGTLKGAGPFVVVPNQVAVDTPVTLTVSDTAGSAPANAALTVKPRTVSNVVTVTPSASQSAACGTAVCSGGDAEVKVVLSQGGIPLVGRAVQFDVVSGDIRIIVSAPGASEDDELSGTATTDSSGTARIRIRARSDATSQTALLQITDVASGSSQTASITVAPATNAPLNAQPATIAFIGPSANVCATGTRADVIVFGGRAPYAISQPGTFTINTTSVPESGGRFTVEATGQCTTSSPIAVVDSNGASVTVTASNQPGTSAAISSVVVAPKDVTIGGCNDQVTVAIAGGLGSGNYFAASGSSFLNASVNGSTGIITRNQNAILPTSGTGNVAFSDGHTSDTVTVQFPLTACP
ncbi:MAG TPA: hypothetical protein VHQ02_05735 [Usitatibacter sp.]|nr:hypothetical protein [Usitatibacter sp.]